MRVLEEIGGEIAGLVGMSEAKTVTETNAAHNSGSVTEVNELARRNIIGHR
jgi:hypothetical protein